VGRLFWKFFLSILLAQLAATVGIGGAIWLKHRATPQQLATIDLDTSPPAELSINAAAATLEFGGPKALRSLLATMERHRVFVVDDKNHELLGRIVTVGMLAEARYLLNQGSETRVVRRVTDSDGNRYLLFLPSAAHQMGIDASAPRPLLAGLAASTPLMRLEPRHEPGAPVNDARGERGPGQPPDGPPSGPAAGIAPHDNGHGIGPRPGDDPGMGPRPDDDGRGGPPPGPRFQPLTPFVPIAAAVTASLLMAGLLAWYFSRPIRELRLAFEAASGGDLAPRFAGVAGRRGGSDLNDLGRDFDRMTARLRNLIDGQTRLLHDVSHELRSPLARLQAAIGLAHQQPDKMAASMERIERESVRMDQLVGQLLTLARLESGAISAASEEISMADLLDQIADDASFEAAAQGRSVVREGDADVRMLGQPDLLGRAIENVVRNAVKHSADGGVVQLQLHAQPDARRLCIRVLDRGPGVSPADLDAIFQPFFRASAVHKDIDGHGLGLAIAQHVVHAHGGTITASNRADGGLCVEMMLPAAPQSTGSNPKRDA